MSRQSLQRTGNLTCEWIHNVLLSFMVLRRKASKSKKTSFGLSLYRAGWCGMIEAKSRFRQPSLTNDTDPLACGSSGSGETVTSISFTYFQTLAELILALSCSFVPIGTAWSTGTSSFLRWWGATVVEWFRWGLSLMPLTRASGGASLYNATSYSSRPGVSSTTPDTRAPWGLKCYLNFFNGFFFNVWMITFFIGTNFSLKLY